MGLLLTVAAGDDPAREAAAVARLGRPLEVLREAATFFIEQILFAPGGDSYRVLGASPAASTGELRHNMALLMRWLHPDVARAGERAVFAQRIAAAWNTLKTPERRAAYDRERQSAAVPADGAHFEGAGARGRSGRGHRSKVPGRRRSRLPRFLAFWLLGRSRY
jgi:curved DNA-binding protein CbpA